MLDPVELVIVPLDVAVGALDSLLTPDERARAARFAFERDRRRFIVGRARLRQLLGARLGAAPQSLDFVYGAHGKPALARRAERRDLRFNLAHHEGVAVYAFAEGAEVGVDVEAVRRLEDADDVAQRCFSPAEHEVCRTCGFFYCWTRKEAFVKALGCGLSRPLTDIDVTAAPPGWKLRSFVPGPGLIGALAVEMRVQRQ
jgi:4'-phosphopantetheinyl transferase